MKNNQKSEKKDKETPKAEPKPELTEQLQRVQAEFENYQKRVQREKEDLIKFSKENLITDLLETLDNFERALDSIEKSNNNEEIKQGINIIFKQLKQKLIQEGLEEIQAINEKFDPNVHEAIAMVDSDKEKNLIIEELLRGYKLNGKTIRPSKVKVSNGGKQNE
ncbi:MAG: nucleotide exchange factor GrpE [archaeon]